MFSILYLLPNYVNVGFAGREAIKMIPYLVTIVVLVITSIVSRRESQPPGVAGAQLFQGRAIADPRGQMPQNSLRGGGCGMRVAHRMCGVNAITVTVGGALRRGFSVFCTVCGFQAVRLAGGKGHRDSRRTLLWGQCGASDGMRSRGGAAAKRNAADAGTTA